MKIIHLTDTHFVPEGKTLYSRDPSVALHSAIRDININHSDADRLVLTGDLTHWGEPEAFEHLRRVLDNLSIPFTLLVGNHDDRDVFSASFPSQQRDSSGFVQSALKTHVGTFVFLDTMLEGTHAGHYCLDRQSWLRDTLASTDGDIFLFMHHPPFDTGLAPIDRIGLQQKDAFRVVIEPHRERIRHLFFGHVHRPIAGSWLGIPTSTVRAMNHQVWFDMTAETLLGSFEPPAYAVVLIDDEKVVVHNHDFMDESERFSMKDSPWDDWSRKSAHP